MPHLKLANLDGTSRVRPSLLSSAQWYPEGLTRTMVVQILSVSPCIIGVPKDVA